MIPPKDGAEAVCPFPGLAPFTAEQAEWFFGRDQLSADLLGRLDAQLAGGGPVIVVAASGAGKSSLLRAGLLHDVASGRLPAAGSAHWPRVVFTPGAHPVREAANALALAMADTPDAYAVLEDVGPADLDDRLRHLVERSAGHSGAPARVVLVVDQFEELFTLCESEAERGLFISWLWEAADHRRVAGPLALVACGLRADFYAECLRSYPQLRRSLQEGQLVVGPMSEEELREAIRCPAEMVGLDIEDSLIELLLADLRANRAPSGADLAADYDAGRLPLLAYALRATWQRRHGSTLTAEGYRATGGIDHAIAETAERVFARMDDAGRHEAKVMFLRLVKIGASSAEDARRPVARSDLIAGSEVAPAVLDEFVASRLLTSAREAIQITHEALLSAWPRLKGWLDEDRAGHLVRQEIEDNAAGWERVRGDTSLLYRGARLQTAATWAAARPGELTATARDFLAASRRLARRATAIRRGATAGLAALALIASVFAVIAFRQTATADQQRDKAVYNEASAEAIELGSTDTSLAAALNVAAYNIKPAPDTNLNSRLLGTENTPLATTLPSDAGSVFSVAFSANSRVLATGNENGTVRLWNVADPAHAQVLGRPLAGCNGHIHSVAFSPNGKILANGCNGGTIQLWDMANASDPRPFGRPVAAMDGYVYSIAFSPKGNLLAADGENIQLWDVSDPSRPKLLSQLADTGPDIISSVAFSPNGRILATAGDGNNDVRLWDVANPEQLRPLGPPLTTGSSSSYSVAFSPNGDILAAGTSNGTIELWDMASPNHPLAPSEIMAGPEGDVIRSVAFSSDGSELADGGTNGLLSLWNVADPADPTSIGSSLAANTNIVASVAFSPDGRTLASAGYGGTTRLWSLPRTLLDSGGNTVASVAFSQNSRLFAAGGSGNTVGLWDVADPAAPRSVGQILAGPIAYINAVEFSPNGRILAIGGYNGMVQLWNVAEPARPRALGRVLRMGTNDVESLAFNPNGRVLVGRDYIGDLQLWDVTNPESPHAINQLATSGTSIASSAAFSPNGRILASGGDGMIQLWNMTNVSKPRDLGEISAGDTNSVYTIAYSPDGRFLASGSDDGLVQLWNVTDSSHYRPLGRAFSAGTGPIQSIAFSADASVMASGGSDGLIYLWDLTNPTRPKLIVGPFSSGSSTIYSVAISPYGPILATGGDDGVIRLWTTDLQYAIQRICETTGGGLTSQQWDSYIQLPYRRSCAN